MKMTAAQRAEMMRSAPISRVIPRLAIPTIFSMLITNIYNIADTYFVSQISTSASGAVGVIFSAMAIIQAIAFTIGMGSGTNVSRALGAGNVDEAQTYCSVGFFTAVGTGLVITILGNLSINGLVRFLGATETIAPYARSYAMYIFYAAPFMMGSLVLNNLLRFQGLAMYGMIGITSGGILNMLLDPLLIFGFRMGIAGAAIATAISQAISFIILLLQCTLHKDAITITPRRFKPTAKMYGRILYNGFPSLGRQGIASVSTILLNNAAGVYGDPAIAAMSICSRFIMFVNSTVIGFGQGFQPVCGFCYGAGKYKRVRESFWFCVKVSTVILLVLGAISFAFAGPIVTVFRREDPEVIRIGTLALRLQLSTIPLWGFIVMSNMFTQSIGYGVRSTIISIARQGLFLIPMLLILPSVFGLLGIQMAQPIADVLTLGLTIVIVTGVLRQMKAMPDREDSGQDKAAVPES
ncbi:MAG: MATE family efflux transporter [Christensenellaceae bacterium]|nr:MATE family efflux transporter [Christensenellaceae bacterium]